MAGRGNNKFNEPLPEALENEVNTVYCPFGLMSSPTYNSGFLLCLFHRE